MKKVLAAAAMVVVSTPSIFAQQRTIAITIDDLPVVTTSTDPKVRREIVKKIVGHLKAAKVPAIAFVNEGGLYADGKRDESRIDLLRLYLEAGVELGNHSYSHRSLNRITLTEYEDDILKGETITKELLKTKGREIRYFRHPFLQTGRTMEIKQQFDDFLKLHGYRIAPISFDNADYIFAKAYDVARDKGDRAAMKQVGDAYVPYMESKLIYWEGQSRKLFNREISQTLLIHSNAINAEYLDDLIAMFKRRGYKCVDLETALRDDAYQLSDTYVGAGGISWLHRWARERGREFIVADEPKVPDFVLKLSGFESE
jgi:peptidoglycan/xylan/chitin deacetylase (PgdA/CDA1 family)